MSGKNFRKKRRLLFLVCVFCGKKPRFPLVINGKAVCQECFSELYRQSIKRISSIKERRYASSV
ncbi:MAG TPA: hypothetical protein DEA47_01085 [Peptococcaceae bacterium]|nr:hypothetical protein [Peptococcaceae bacterium]